MAGMNGPSLDRGFTSPNYNERDGADIDYLVIHHTATSDSRSALSRYLDSQPGGNGGAISPHYLIAEEGHIFYLVDEDKRAWHAGHSCWDGRHDLNSYSIGIELAHPGWDAGHGFTQAQCYSLKVLGVDIVRRHNIRAYHILGHSDISADRKHDPGYWFPWADMAQAGLGLWPDTHADNDMAAERAVNNPDQGHDWLYDYGYCRCYHKGDLMYAFYQHFYPEAFDNTHAPDTHNPDRQALARLHRLVQLKNKALRPSAEWS
jgi:N-acetylmuramoyl-L-alanine amidase